MPDWRRTPKATLMPQDLTEYRELAVERAALETQTVRDVTFEQAREFWRRWHSFWERIQREYGLDTDPAWECNWWTGDIVDSGRHE